MERWFTKGFREREPTSWSRDVKAMFVATPVEGYVGCCAAIRDMDHRALLPKIKAPTLVIAGRQDPATTVGGGRIHPQPHSGRQARRARRRAYRQFEQPQAYTDTVLGFLTKK